MTREEMHDLILGAAVIALAYAVYQHGKPKVSAATINMSDQLAIDTAMGAGQGDGPAINMPAPIAVQGNDRDGYTIDTTSEGWLSKLTNGVL